MKKRHYVFLGIGFAALCGAGIVSVNVACNNQIAEVRAEATELVAGENEEPSKAEEIVAVIDEKIETIKNFQIAGTTIGGIVGAVMGSVIAFIPALLNRANIKEAKKNLSDARTVLIEVRDTYNIADPKLDKAIASLEKGGNMYKEVVAEYKDIRKDMEVMREESNKIITALLVIITSNPEMIKNGVAEKLNEIFKRE